jgi:hypothetical protein
MWILARIRILLIEFEEIAINHIPSTSLEEVAFNTMPEGKEVYTCAIPSDLVTQWFPWFSSLVPKWGE